MDKIYTKEYLEELDQEIKMIPLVYDISFKSVMMKNIDLFKEFLIKTLHLDINEDDNYLIFLDKELIRYHFKEHGKVIDMNIKLGKNLLIDVEINTEKYSFIKRRNDLYLEKLDTLSFEVGDEYQELNSQYIYQLNLNCHKRENMNVGEKVIVQYDIMNQQVDDDRLKIFIKNLAFYRNQYYNGGNLSNFDEILLVSFTATTFLEFYEIVSNILSGERLDRLMESVIDMSKDEFILHAWMKEKMDKMVQENAKKGAYEEGIEDGIEQGIEQGIKQNKMDVIKSMLENRVDNELISKVTGKSIEEIKEIEESIMK